jgi:small redox-active disulfide protein 2
VAAGVGEVSAPGGGGSDVKIKVLGMGCPRCKVLYAEVAKAVKASSVDAQLEKVETIEGILAYRVMATPALVVDGEVKCVGRVPPLKEIVAWIATAAAGPRAGADRSHL